MTLNGQAASVLDGNDREAVKKGVWLERSWGSANQLRPAKGGSRQLVGVLRNGRCSSIFPSVILSEEFGVPLLPEVTKKCVPYWVSGDA